VLWLRNTAAEDGSWINVWDLNVVINAAAGKEEAELMARHLVHGCGNADRLWLDFLRVQVIRPQIARWQLRNMSRS
jgi:hypothetical protein